MAEIVPLQEVENVDLVSAEVRDLILDPANNDLVLDFPGTVHRYGQDIDIVRDNLSKTIEELKPGKREQFLLYEEDRLAGMSIVTKDITSPKSVDPTSPNVSLLLSKPFRGRGLGSLLLQHNLEVISERFDGQAWTLVRKDNNSSQRLLQAAGFTRSEVVVPGSEHQDLYLFESTSGFANAQTFLEPRWPRISLNLHRAARSEQYSEILEQITSQVHEAYHSRILAIGDLALKQAELERINNELGESVRRARTVGASWSDIGRAVGTDPVNATRRWDSKARERIRNYRNQKSK